MPLALAVSEQSLDIDLQQVKSNSENINENSGCTDKTQRKISKGLIPWQKGQSGNPTGRPKGFAELRHGILEFYQKRPQEAIRRLYRERIDLFFAYAFGKPADRVELSGPDGGAIEVAQADVTALMLELSKRGVDIPK